MPLILPAETKGPLNARYEAEKVKPSQMSEAEAAELNEEAARAFRELVREIRNQVVNGDKLRVYATVYVSAGRWIDELPELIEKYAYEPKEVPFAHVPDGTEKISVIPINEKYVDPFRDGYWTLKILMTYTLICCDPRPDH